ncbi:MAG: pre-16S rRNA-processing nuclease YqgF [Candidatus Tumulicola sp.]
MSGGVLGVDPGSHKAGFAVLDAEGTAVASGIVPVASLCGCLAAVLAEHPVEALALGRGTNAATLAAQLSGLGVPIHLIDEYETTRRARELYLAEHPPRGWRRLLPRGLVLPPRPVDDYAAILIARRFLARESGQEPPT